MSISRCGALLKQDAACRVLCLTWNSSKAHSSPILQALKHFSTWITNFTMTAHVFSVVYLLESVPDWYLGDKMTILSFLLLLLLLNTFYDFILLQAKMLNLLIVCKDFFFVVNQIFLKLSLIILKWIQNLSLHF